MYMKLKEIIVVEGKNDTNVIQSYIDCDTIETNGTHLGKMVLQLIKQAQQARGVIIFTDPDYPGEKIRATINQHIPGCKNAFIEKNKAKTTKKVGIEHASKTDIIEALSNLMTYQTEVVETLRYDEFISFGFTGLPDSAEKRSWIAKKLYLGKPNAKTLYKRLNMLQLHSEDVANLLGDFNEQ